MIKEEINDARMSYHHHKEPLDLAHNFSLALENSSGEFVCFIGDDDGVLPEIVDAAVWAKSRGYDALLPTRPAQYWWPDIRHRYYRDSLAGNLEIKRFTAKLSVPDPERELVRCARGAGRVFFNLPKIYYGLVRRECLNKVKDVCGTYFPGPSPDLAGAVAVASYVKNMCMVDYPLFLPGSSAGSGAGLGAIKKHEGRLEDQPHLPKSILDNWSKLVPKFFSGRTIWGEDVVQALRATGREDILRLFNVSLLHAMCAVFNPGQLPATLKNLIPALRSNEQNVPLGVLWFAWGYLYTWALRSGSHLARLARMLALDRSTTVGDIPDIEEGVKALTEHIKVMGKTFSQLT